jgi:heat shock protein HslJ
MFAAPRRVAVAIACLVVATGGCSRQRQTDAAAQSDTTRSDTSAATPASDSGVASTNLRGTDWRLVSLADKAVTSPADSQRVAHIVLKADAKTISGSGGCNRLFGVYELNGEALRFSGVGSTKMACKDGMDTETAFLPALLRVKRWKIAGRQLELSDSTGTVLARFEAK